jgi:hypothetical protein
LFQGCSHYCELISGPPPDAAYAGGCDSAGRGQPRCVGRGDTWRRRLTASIKRSGPKGGWPVAAQGSCYPGPGGSRSARGPAERQGPCDRIMWLGVSGRP